MGRSGPLQLRPVRIDARTALWHNIVTPPIGSTVGSRPLRTAASVFFRSQMITNFYIDGFNLYYRALKDTPFRWLDLRQLAANLFPDDEIKNVCYFTALLNARPDNPDQPARQLTYLRALQTLPELHIYYGSFRPRIKTRRLAEPIPGLPEYVRILDSEEKGTDVNLATRLLVDGFSGAYDQAVVVSNDADLASPMRYVRDELNLKMTVVNPDNNNHTHRDLVDSATYVRRLRKSHLRRSQLAPIMNDGQGPFTKPPTW